MRGTLRIITPATRARVVEEIRNLQDGYEVVIRQPTRTRNQNKKLWAMIGDVAVVRPDGRLHSAETWKCLFMHALGHEVRFETGLNGEPFPVGFRSSRLSKAQMADLITFVAEYGDRHGVRWSEPNPYEVTA